MSYFLRLYCVGFFLLVSHLQAVFANNHTIISQNQKVSVHTVDGDGFWLACDLDGFTHCFEQVEVTEQREDIEDEDALSYIYGGILVEAMPHHFDIKCSSKLNHFDNFKFGANPFALFIIFHSWKYHI